ncbi:MAG TPA: hypothetical protein VJ885_15955, partial [Thermoanaerobaculia bacterium]|nr:hypothetical protein [Thermoanaerobaculia bacterium]
MKKTYPLSFLPLLLLLGVLAACRTAPVPPPARPAPAPQPVPPVEEPARPAEPRPAPAPVEPDIQSGPPARLLLKVGLATDLATVTFPCCEEPLVVAMGDQPVEVVGALKVEPAAAGASKGFYSIQAAALRDERQAQELADRLARETGQPGSKHF